MLCTLPGWMVDSDMDDMTERPRLHARQTNERPHVLVVTDDRSLSEFLAEGLPLGGFWVSVIASGIQALEVFRLRSFDIVVIDAGLQSFQAMELIGRLRGKSTRVQGNEPRTLAPLVIVSERDLKISGEDRHDLAIAAVLQAPLEIDEIVRQLHDIFGRWRQDNPDALLADSANFLR